MTSEEISNERHSPPSVSGDSLTSGDSLPLLDEKFDLATFEPEKHQTLRSDVVPIKESVLSIRGFNFWYGDKQVLHDVSVRIGKGEVTAIIGPSGCGKSTLLTSINRLNELNDGVRYDGTIEYDGMSIHGKRDVVSLRREVGMIFQKPNPFPKSIFDNIAFAPKLHFKKMSKTELTELVEWALEKAGLLNEVRDRLHERGAKLSGGQEQRLCIARALAVQPRLLLMDEPTSALDPKSAKKVEGLMDELKSICPVMLVTHSLAQAKRISDRTLVMLNGALVEEGPTSSLFDSPQHPFTRDYVKFGMF